MAAVIGAAAALAGGCTSVPSRYAEQLAAATREYQQFAASETLASLEERYGAPQRIDGDGACVWETRYDDLNFTALRVWFGDDGLVIRRETIRSWGTRSPVHRASAVVTTER